MESKLVLAYLDDITLGDDTETVLKDVLHQLEEAALRMGLKINKDKCEVVASRSLFATNNAALLDLLSSVVLLGTPLFAGPHLESLLEVRRDELLLLSKRLCNSCHMQPMTACFYCALF